MFRDQLLGLIKKGSGLLVKSGSHTSAAVVAHGEGEAERLVMRGLGELGLADDSGGLLPGRKGDRRKVALATVIKSQTSVGNEWLARRLQMGHNRSVSRLIRQGADDPEIREMCKNLRKMLPCED